MISLGIEASTYTGSVAVIRDGAVVVEDVAAMRGEHEERLMPAVAESLDRAGVPPNAVERVICGAGPGSFTSLRIAAAIAKGLALSANAALHPVSSLLLIVAGARPVLVPGHYVAVLDAMRGDVFAAAFSVSDSAILAMSSTTILARADVAHFAREHAARAIGPAEELVAFPHARGAATLGSLIPWPDAASLGAWEPTYGRLAEAQVKWEAAHGRALIPQ